MAKNNLQVRVDPKMESEIESLAPASKSDFVRQAIQEKIAREKNKALEDLWIRALQKDSDEGTLDADWMRSEAWGDK